MQLPDYILQKAKASRARIVLPEAHDPRIIQAACIATEQNLAQIILLGTPDHINRSAHNQGLTLDGISVIDPKTSPLSNQYAELLVTNSLKARITLEKALQRIQTSIVFANCMVANNEAEGCVAGATMSTAEVIRHAIRIVGQNSANAVVSSFFLMIFDSTNPGIQGPVLFADCGLINDPDANELAALAAATAHNAELLLNMPPTVAMLSFSTLGSARHPQVTKVRRAVKLLTDRYPGLSVQGEVQFDAAIIPEILESKSSRPSDFARPNVFIFPNLDAGNIAYKLAERTAGATAIGPILQGIKKPINDLSRGCSVHDIVQNIAVTACQAAELRS